MMDVYEMGLVIDSLCKMFTQLEMRVADLESPKLEFPPIDLGLIPGTGPEPKHPFEPFEYSERS